MKKWFIIGTVALSLLIGFSFSCTSDQLADTKDSLVDTQIVLDTVEATTDDESTKETVGEIKDILTEVEGVVDALPATDENPEAIEETVSTIALTVSKFLPFPYNLIVALTGIGVTGFLAHKRGKKVGEKSRS